MPSPLMYVYPAPILPIELVALGAFLLMMIGIVKRYPGGVLLVTGAGMVLGLTLPMNRMTPMGDLAFDVWLLMVAVALSSTTRFTLR